MMAEDQFDALLDDVMALPPEERMAGALAVFRREHARLRALFNHHSWAQGRRGDGVAIIPGLTDTLTGLVRRFAACGLVRHEDVDDLSRHVSALRKWLAKNAPAVVIANRKAEGYEVIAGFDDLYRLLYTAQAQTEAPQRRRAPGFTLHQSAILFHLAMHGSAHMGQFPCLPRHISNIRALLEAQGLGHIVAIETRVGEGVYVVAKGRDELRRLIVGEAADADEPRQAQALECVA